MHGIPEGLPEPRDDGACVHLPGMPLVKRSTLMIEDGESQDLLSRFPAGINAEGAIGWLSERKLERMRR